MNARVVCVLFVQQQKGPNIYDDDEIEIFRKSELYRIILTINRDTEHNSLRWSFSRPPSQTQPFRLSN